MKNKRSAKPAINASKTLQYGHAPLVSALRSRKPAVLHCLLNQMRASPGNSWSASLI
jgi:hypothetical protein